MNTEQQLNEMTKETLKELQEYRELGTLQELKELKERTLTPIEMVKILAAMHTLKKYESIGTVEECRKAREKEIPSEDNWIRCANRMPKVPVGAVEEEWPQFIVTIKGATESTTLRCNPEGIWSDDFGNEYEVTAWQQLPEICKDGH